jgi:hypothetical protein
VFLAGSLMSSSFISGASDTKSSDHRRLLESGRASGAHVLTAACALHAGARSPFARGRCDRASCDSSRGLPSPVTSPAADSRSGAALPPTHAVVPAPPNHRAVGDCSSFDRIESPPSCMRATGSPQAPDDLCSSLHRLPFVRPSPFRDELLLTPVGLAWDKPTVL